MGGLAGKPRKMWEISCQSWPNLIFPATIDSDISIGYEDCFHPIKTHLQCRVSS